MKNTSNTDLLPKPNLIDYDSFCRDFSWEKVSQDLDGLPDSKGLNIAYEAVERHSRSENKDRIALKWLAKDGANERFTYDGLNRQANMFANILRDLELSKGDTVFLLTGRIPALYIAALGTWKNRNVFCPLFSAFGPEPIFQRLDKGKARVLVTTEKAFQKKIMPLLGRLDNLKYVLLVDAEEHLSQYVLSLPFLMSEADDEFITPPTDAEDPAILHFTSGTTGEPKGAVHIHQAVMTHYATGKYVLDIHDDDIFWCTADPGWVTGTSYGIIAPLTLGVTSIIDEADFDVERWYTVLEEQKVNVWYTAPTAIRMLMRSTIKPLEHFDLSELRIIHSVGEPLNAEAIVWAEKALGLPIHDNWWQTETGGIMISNFASLKIKPGSMGKPLPGIEVAIVRQTETGLKKLRTGEIGDLALKKGWPSMFTTYLHQKDRYEKSFSGDWYITGDLAKKDKDGYFWFVGRADDIIKTSGHMVGPFEVESILMEHEAVAEAAVIGIPDKVIGEKVLAFVSLKSGYDPTQELQLDIKGFARKRLGSAIAPKEIRFEDNLPKTRSGKIMRRLLKAIETGTPTGDLSTLEIIDERKKPQKVK